MAETATEPKKGRGRPPGQLAEYKYIGDDGGRWVFERRKDGLCVTIDKPKAELGIKSGQMPVLLTVQGFHVHEAAMALCKK
jgi:hypothetical protein